eukprot:5673833-Amphidinium_carterae.1
MSQSLSLRGTVVTEMSVEERIAHRCDSSEMVARATGHAYGKSYEKVQAGKRRFNRAMIERLDRALLASTGIGIATYLPKRRPLALVLGETREVRQNWQIQVKGASVSRAVVVREGQASVEIPRRSVSDNSAPLPALHMVLDQGQVGVPLACFLYQCLGIRGCLTFDILHRIQNDVLAAVKGSRLFLARMAFAAALKVTESGPFRTLSNFRLVQEHASDYFLSRSTTCELFQTIVPEVVDSHSRLRVLCDSDASRSDDAAWEYLKSSILTDS